MTRECLEFLNLRTKPGLCGGQEAGWILGMPEDWIGILVREGVLPLATKHTAGCQFYFCTATLLQLAQNPPWLEKAVKTVRKAFNAKKQASKQTPAAITGGSNA